MAVIQTTQLPITTMTSFSFPAPPSLPLLRFSLSSMRIHEPNFHSLTILNRPSSLTSTITTTKRKLLCKPPSAKYVREDYLVKKYSAQEVQELLKGERTVPIIIDFYATWCGPCILMAQELELLAVEYESNALFIKVDTDDEYEFARDMQVRGLPTLFFISPAPNKDAIRTEGLIPAQMIRDIIDNEM
ncbi:PREDICTED: thioredoxin-like protein CITRX, chloroplastic [Nelumbo nucifera]|uniref:Thioredoxin-like protein CITRX, chloroplastic n=1 Tax=Nelumbo nucifera TaxID=4432 RepID=A0A1U8B6S3_NELNU|nr:PREDICTED: thioredoxin-like protein CITRX, chloroplastic [Nelumbo nucifera]